ncbi:MAG: DUF427 domain-containing protein [Oligoflexales bacterium]|nr:DUF427 domain-containing protein [Oligoflexales bacterium]
MKNKLNLDLSRVFQPKSSRLDQLANLWGRHKKNKDLIELAGPDEESVWSYPRPPAVVIVQNDFSVLLAGTKLLQAKQAVKVMETASPPTYYFDREDILCRFQISERKSHCEWKGTASYLDFTIENQVIRNVAWFYENPYSEYKMLEGLVSLYPSKFDVFRGEEKVKAQSGDFYGGWITSEIKGPFKGDPGTEAW